MISLYGLFIRVFWRISRKYRLNLEEGVDSIDTNNNNFSY